ncbi:MAG: hypothetical protein V3S89_13375, partial [Desulfobacterales bacterium]
QSKKLMDSVLQYEDFPILIETWRTCLQDEFDLDNLRTVLTDLASGSTAWTEIHMNYPSPMARSESWQQINQYMYMDDTPQSGKTSMLRSDLLQDLVFTPGLRPAVSRELVERFELKRKRLHPGYSPDTAQDLLDWVKERLVIPEPEWKALLHAIRTDHDLAPDDILEPVSNKLLVVKQPNTSPMVIAREKASTIVTTLYGPSSDAQIESILPNAAAGDTPRIPTIPRDGEGADDNDDGLADLIGEWLQFYGPVTLRFIHTTLGIALARLSQAMDDLIDTRKVIAGQLIEDDSDNDAYLCDSENYESLLRIKRKESEPSFEPMDIGWLPLFLADHQGVTGHGNGHGSGIDGLSNCMEQLLCFAAPAELWETEILPARLQPYDISWLDSTMQESDLIWIGSQNHRIAFCFESDLDLIPEEMGSIQHDDRHEETSPAESDNPGTDRNDKPRTDAWSGLFPRVEGRYDFSTLLETSSHNTAELTEILWDAVWQGSVTNDTSVTLRRGIENHFKAAPAAKEKSRPSTRGGRFRSRTRFSKWKGGLPSSGYWRIIPTPESETDLLETEEIKKERVRLLLDRYGILFRELLLRELPALRWSSLFRSLRLMEFSGEVMTGCFFDDIPGPQFISHQALQRLGQNMAEDSIYWINATDPASLCGIQLEKIKGTLPRRVSGTHLVYRGNRIVAVSKRNGRSLSFDVPPDDPQIDEIQAFLDHLLTRRFQPLRQITIETINEVGAAQSEYVDSLRIRFEVIIDYKNVVLYKRSV